MTTRRKVRSDAKLEQLNDAQRDKMLVWLDHENCSYTEVAARVRHEFGLSVGRTAIAGYYRRHILPLHHDDEAETALALADLPDAPFDAATVKMARRLAWSAISLPTPDIKRASAMLELVRKAERQSIAERRLELDARRVVVREKEAAYRTRRRPRTTEEEDPIVTAPLSAVRPPEPATPIAPLEEPTSAEALDTPSAEAPSQKILQNLPLCSPYFGLIPPPIPAEIHPVPAPEISPTELTQVEDILSQTEAYDPSLVATSLAA